MKSLTRSNTESAPFWQHRGFAAGLIVLAWALTRIIFHLFLIPTVASGDSRYYLTVAQNILNVGVHSDLPDGTPTFYRAPLYPALLAGLYRLLAVVGLKASFFGATVAMQSILGLATALIVYHGMPNRVAALIAGLLVATFPGLIFLENRILTESLTTFLATAGMVLWITSPRRMVSVRTVLAGLAFGLATLSTQIYMLLPFALLLFSAVLARALFARTFVLTAVAVLCMVPWIARNAALENGGPFLSKGIFGYTLWVGTWERDSSWLGHGFEEYSFRSEAEKEQLTRALQEEGTGAPVFKKIAIERISAHPIDTAGIWLRRLPYMWIGTRAELVELIFPRGGTAWTVIKALLWVYNAGILLLAAIGIVLTIRRKSLVAAYSAQIIYLTGMYLPFHSMESRYSSTATPVACLFAALAIASLAARAARAAASAGRLPKDSGAPLNRSKYGFHSRERGDVP